MFAMGIGCSWSVWSISAMVLAYLVYALLYPEKF